MKKSTILKRNISVILLYLLVFFIFYSGQTFAQECNNIYIDTSVSEKKLEVKISAQKSIGEYKSFFLKDDNPSKLIVDISGCWKNQGKFLINVENEIVERIRIGEHPAWKAVLENSEVTEEHPACLRVVLDLKVKGHPPFYKIRKSAEETIIISIMSMRISQSGKINLNQMEVISPEDIYDTSISLLRLKQYEEALKRFEYVKKYADSESLKSDAEIFVKAIKKLLRPYNLVTKVSYGYDDYVQLKPLDSNIYKKKADYVTTGYFAGKYNFINKTDKKMGIGYSHYQAWHNDLYEYDLTGSLLDIYFKYKYKDIIFGLNYLPSYYWVNSESYLMYHLFKFDLGLKLSKNFNTKISYSHYANNYLQDNNRDGHTNEIFMNIFYNIGDDKGSVFGGFGLEDNSPSHPDYSYTRLKTKSGFSFKLSWEMAFTLTGELSEKKYDNTDTIFNIQRKETEFLSSILLSRKLFYDWLLLIFEFGYTINNSNIEIFDYEKQEASIALTATY